MCLKSVTFKMEQFFASLDKALSSKELGDSLDDVFSRRTKHGMFLCQISNRHD
jgi:hypothetical protein